MKNYQNPELDIVLFSSEDVLTGSVENFSNESVTTSTTEFDNNAFAQKFLSK